jgi:V/A-type H+-transporting ATPase subunit F
MKYFLISDNVDTLAGMRLVGVRGVVVHEPEEVRAALDKACADPEIGLVLITDKLVARCADVVFSYKLTRKRPLIVEMPDRHSETNPGEQIKRYIAEVVGVKIG